MQLHRAGKAECLQPGNQLLDDGEAPVTVGFLANIIGTALVDCPGNAVIEAVGLFGGALSLQLELRAQCLAG